jgi:acyl-CoA reductase-like NAD-dependent aldehyde dehydrogenase
MRRRPRSTASTAGGIMISDSSTFRVDHMPYGGTKQSRFGREGSHSRSTR